MTEIIFINKDESVQLTVKGHAGYNPGNDIVCASISQLVCTFASLIEDYCINMIIDEIYLNDGDVRISFRNKPGKHLVPEIAAFCMYTIRGFEMLEDAFPDNVKFQCVLENKKFS